MILYIIRLLKASLLLLCLGLQFSFSQSVSLAVSGQVIDTNGKPLKGVSVSSEKGKNGTSTDSQGQYQITISDGSKGIYFSFPEYHTKFIVLNVIDEINVVLERDIHRVDEVIPLGWDEQERRLTVGAVSTVSGKTLEKSPVANLTLTFPGHLSGLTTQETYSELSRATTNLNIRGFSTSRASAPLVMVDGLMIPYNPNQTMDYISANEIESISLLKDGVSQSMYGILGGNGVLLIKTKRGRKGPFEVSTRFDQSLQQVTTKPTMLSSGKYAVLRQEAWHNDYSNQANYTPLFTSEQIEKFQQGNDPLYPDNNWYDYYFKDLVNMQRLGVNAIGGNDRVQYYSNVNFMHQSGFFKTEQDKYNPNPYNIWVNYRSNVDMKVTNYLNAFIRLGGNVKREHTPGEGNSTIYNSIFQLPPTMFGPLTPEAYDPVTGEELEDSRQVITSGNVTTPTYGMLNRRGYRNHTVTNIVSQFGVNLDMSFFTQGLSASGLFAYQTNTVGSLNTLQDYLRMRRNTINWDELDFSSVGSNVNEPLTYSKSHSHYYHLSYQGQLNYLRLFGKHRFGGVGYMFYQNLIKSDTGSPALFPYNRMSSGLKLTYAYDERYMLELNSGYSGSEQFARNKRYTFTPGIGVAWSFKNESFLKEVESISLAKLRGSWARTATDQNGQGRFTYIDDVQVNRGGYLPYLQYVISENRFGNPNYEAELITKRNVGFDIGLYNIVSISVDLFDEKINNMMVGATTTIPLFQGIPLGNYPSVNSGVYKNKGYEIAVDAKKQIHSNWFVTIGGHIGYNKNKIINTGEAERATDYIYPFRSEGQSVGQSFGYLIDYSNGNGYINTTEELENSPNYERQKRLGDFLYQDLNGDGIVDDRDRVPLGTGSIPEVYYGLNASIKWKNFDLSLLFQGVGKYSRITTGWGVHEHHFEGIYTGFHQQAWTQERYQSGETITYPALSTNATASHEANDFFLYNLSYLRLKNIEVGYNLPLRLSKKIGADNIRVLFSGQNLLTWHNMKTNDFGPEGNGFGAIPVYRVYNFGVNLIF